MTVGSGLYISRAERDQNKQNYVIQQLIEGRSNAVGIVTLAHDGAATTTVVSAPTCGHNSAVLLFPTTANAAAVVASTYVQEPDVVPKQFTITHAATSNADMTFYWVCIG